MPGPSILQFEFEDVLDPRVRELCALAAAAAGGCGH
ncbi:MAG: carboxymuconolactone decarboxylase family protein [Deferrisomatales bacterium]